MNALYIRNLSKKYDGFFLDNINITLPKGSIMGFIGENGAGKSTTIKLILELIKRDSGEIKIYDLDNRENSSDLKQNIGVVLDECSFPENLTIKEIRIILKNVYKNWTEEDFSKYIQKFELPMQKKIKEFSKGMKMKLSIAAALSHKANFLIFDEPTSGLDPVVRDEILDVLLDFIQNPENTIFMSSHITSDLEKIADYITFIHKGKIIMSEPKDEIIYNYGILKCTNDEFEKIDKSLIKGYRKNNFGVEALVLKKDFDRDFIIDNASIDDIMVYIIRSEKS